MVHEIVQLRYMVREIPDQHGEDIEMQIYPSGSTAEESSHFLNQIWDGRRSRSPAEKKKKSSGGLLRKRLCDT